MDLHNHSHSSGKKKTKETFGGLEQLQWELLKMGGVKCYFATLNSVLASLNSVLALMSGAKMECHFNNLMFLKKNIIKLAKYGMKYSR